MNAVLNAKPEAKIEEAPAPKPMEVFSLGEFSTDSERDLNALCTRGQATLVAGLVSSGHYTRLGQLVSRHFVQQFSKRGEQVRILAKEKPLELCNTLREAGADTACVKLIVARDGVTAETITKSVGKTALCVVWMPEHLTGDDTQTYFEAIRKIADSGAAVLVVMALNPGRGEDTFTLRSPVVPDQIFERFWMIFDREHDGGMHGQTCNVLTPVSDPEATGGYTFKAEGGRAVFYFGGRTPRAKSMTRKSLPSFTLAHKVA